MYTRADDYFYINAIEKQASKVIYRKFRINRHELNVLCSVAGYLQLHGRRAVGKKSFTDWLGLNYSLEKRVWAYIDGCLSKGLFHRLAWKNAKNGWSLALTGYGIKVLEDYYLVLEGFEKKDKKRKKLPGFRELVVRVDSLPQYYQMNIAGRDN